MKGSRGRADSGSVSRSSLTRVKSRTMALRQGIVKKENKNNKSYRRLLHHERTEKHRNSYYTIFRTSSNKKCGFHELIFCTNFGM